MGGTLVLFVGRSTREDAVKKIKTSLLNFAEGRTSFEPKKTSFVYSATISINYLDFRMFQSKSTFHFKFNPGSNPNSNLGFGIWIRT